VVSQVGIVTTCEWRDIKRDVGFRIRHGIYCTLASYSSRTYFTLWRSRQFTITVCTSLHTYWILLVCCPSPVLWYRLPTADFPLPGFSNCPCPTATVHSLELHLYCFLFSLTVLRHNLAMVRHVTVHVIKFMLQPELPLIGHNLLYRAWTKRDLIYVLYLY
jgi:hypothetical protein